MSGALWPSELRSRDLSATRGANDTAGGTIFTDKPTELPRHYEGRAQREQVRGRSVPSGIERHAAPAEQLARSATGSATPTYRVEHRVHLHGPYFVSQCVPHPDWLYDMRANDLLRSMLGDRAKSAFLSPWAVACYFWLHLPDLAALGYVLAEYEAPVLESDHTGQCLIPVDAEPRRRVPLLDLALLAGGAA